MYLVGPLFYFLPAQMLYGNRDWEKSVSNNARFGNSSHMVSKPGYHNFRIWMIDPGVVLQKIILDLGGVKLSYLGPPESFYKIKN